jgi:methionyl aminopeptidase
MTAKQVADMAAQELKALGGKPAFLGYQGFPDVICISTNEEVQHTIPGSRILHAGDVVNLDFGVTYNGMITDGGITIPIGGSCSADARRLLDGTKLALDTAISLVRPGVRVGEISRAIETVLNDHKLGIVRELVGHGVGHFLHEDPEIPNYYIGKGAELKPGMTIAIEPITTLGSPAITFDRDGWTIRTKDGSWAAQFEHTVLVTHEGVEVLTAV